MASLYSPLNPNRSQIRLITLLPGKIQDHVSCTLSTCSLADAPVYEALSYVWGDPSTTLPISLDGHDFHATSALESALRHLRYENQQRVMWIDAICINQQDYEERNAQVQLMGDIYAKAQQVAVWLGSRDEASDNAMDQILEIGRAEHLSGIHKYQRCVQGYYIDPRREEVEDIFEPLNKFIESSWFHRTWVIQEVALARSALLYCGNRYIDWDDVAKLTNWIQRHKECCVVGLASLASFTLERFRYRTEKIQMIRSYLAVHGPMLDLTLMSDMFRGQHCTDDHDRIYGFLGLIEKNIIRPDYQISVSEMYRQTALALIAHTRTLDVLSTAGRQRNRHELPFWVPDWSAHMHFARSNFEPQITPDLNSVNFAACGNTLAEVRDLGEAGLSVLGVHVDTVWKTLPLTEWTGNTTRAGGSSLTTIRRNLLLWERIIGMEQRPDSSYPGGGTLIHAYWRTLLGDYVFEESSQSARRLNPQDFNDFLVWREWLRSGENPHLVPENSTVFSTPEGIATVRKFNLAITRTHGSRHAFITTKGYLGVGCSEVYNGSLVCVLFGGKQPYIVRNEQTYLGEDAVPHTWSSFFGAAYVHGIMDGEAIENISESSVLDFRLR
jgi:hypothetical protein